MYLRDNHEESRNLFRSLGQILNIHVGQIDRRYFFVNPPKVIPKLQSLFQHYDSIVSKLDCKQIYNGLCVLDVEFYPIEDEAELVFKSWLNRIGATPSLYQIIEFLNTSNSFPDQICDNSKTLELLSDKNLTRNLLYHDLDDSTFNLRHSAYLLVQGLIDLGKKNKTIQTNSAIQDSLLHLHQILWAMCYFRKNLLRCTRLFELVSDDLFTILSISNPHSNIGDILCTTYRSRYPSLAKWIQKSYLTCGGMDAMSTALYAAKGRVVRIEPTHDYLELAYLVEDGNSQNQSIVYIANLNASVPRTRIDPVKLAELIKFFIFPPFSYLLVYKTHL